MQATRRRTQVARDLQLSSIASGPGAATEETGGGANPSPRDGGEWKEGEGRGGGNRNGIPPWAWVSGWDWGRGLGFRNLGGRIQLRGRCGGGFRRIFFRFRWLPGKKFGIFRFEFGKFKIFCKKLEKI